jgi:outer membrane biosynthesis protein TonB
MPTPDHPSDPDRQPGQSGDATGENPKSPPGIPVAQAIKVRTGRFGELEEHELIHLLDSIDDELSKSRFRESIYISTIFCLALAWFLFYGPRILFHQPEYKDLITAMKEHDKQLTYLDTPHIAPHPPARALPDRKTLQQLQQQPRNTPPAPQQPEPQTPPQPEQPQPQAQSQPRTTAPPVQQPALTLPSAPRPQPLADAPTPRTGTAQNSAPHDPTQDLIRGSRSRGGGDYSPAPNGGSSGPLQAGTTVLSDTMGVDFTSYLNRLTHDIKRNWEPLIPEEVQAPLMKKGVVGIRFSILPDGSIESPMYLETRSGDVALDKAAWSAITSEGTFPRLPPQFHGPKLELRLGFYYNLEAPH